MSAPTPLRVERILGVRLGHIGDVVLVTPALDLLARMFPRAEISMLVRAGTEPILQHHPLVKRVLTGGEITSQQKMHTRSRASFGQRLRQIPHGLQAIRQLRRQRFDLAVDFTGGDRSAIFTFLSGAKVRVGPSAQGKGLPGRDRLYTRVLPGGESLQHKVWNDVALLREVALATGRNEFATDPTFVPGLSSMPPSAADLEWSRTRWAAMTVPGAWRILVHPTSRVLYKCWPAGRWAELIDRCVAGMGAQVVVTSGPDAGELELARLVVASCRRNVQAHLGDLSLGRLAGLIREADLFLGVDTAPMHIAAAVGTRVVAVFGPSRPEVWGPWGPGHRVVRRPCPCAESGQRACDEARGMDCLQALTVEEVYQAVQAATEGMPRQRPSIVP